MNLFTNCSNSFWNFQINKPSAKAGRSFLVYRLLFIAMLFATGISLNAQTLTLQKSVTNSSPAPGEAFDWIIDAACNSTTRDCESVVITDQLPPEVEFLSVSTPLPDGVKAATYNASNHSVTVTFDATNCSSCSPDGINTDNDDFAQGSTIQLLIRVRFPAGTFNGTTANNTVTSTSNNAGSPSDSATATSSGGSNPQTGCNQMVYWSSASPEVLTGGESWYRVRVANAGTTDINNWSSTVVFPNNWDFHQFWTPEIAGYSHTGTVYYQTSAQPGTWNTWTTFNTSVENRLYENDLGLASGVEVIAVRLDMGTLTGDGTWNYDSFISTWEASWRLYGYTDAPAGSSISFCSDVSGSVSGTNCSGSSCASTNVIAGFSELEGSKEIQDLNGVEAYTFNPGDIYQVQLTYASSTSNNTDVEGAVLVDVLPPGMTYVPNSWSNAWATSYPNPVVQTGFLADGRQWVRFVWDTSHGNSFTITADGTWSGLGIDFQVQIGTGVASGEYTNDYYYAATGSSHACSYGEETGPISYLGGYSFDAVYCHRTADLEVLWAPGSAGFESYKEIKGSLDNTYHRYPTTGLTEPSGINDYNIVITNPNSTPLTDVVLIDVFPYVGDTEVLDSGIPRSSGWRPELYSAISAPGATVYYSTSTNPCRNELRNPGDPNPFPSGCTAANWTTTVPSDLSTVTAVKLDYGSTVFNLGDSRTISFQMQTPSNLTGSEGISWNSFAYKVTNASNGAELLSAEPIKVGVEVQEPPCDPSLSCELVGQSVNNTCHKSHDGEFTVQGLNGTGPYEYRVNGGAWTSNNTFTDLIAATFTVDVRDANGCEALACTVVVITEPQAALTCSIIPSPVMVSCFGGNDGSARVKGNNGTPGYSFSMNGAAPVSNGTVEYEFTGLTAGTYSFTVIDANGCETTCDDVIITEPSELICNEINVQDISVFGANDGELEVEGVGGIAPYQYSLNGGTNVLSGSFTGLSAGTYSVEIIDANDCTVTCGDITIIEGPNTLACDIDNVQDVNCFGDNSGSISVIASDGGGTYMYSLNGGSYGSSNTFNDLTAGTYTITVQDQYGTTTDCSNIVVGGPSATLDCSQVGSTTNVSCNNGSDGAFEMSASGGTSPYSYSLNGGTQQSSGVFSGLTAGNYSVEIEDANGCTVTCTAITISEPPSALAINIDGVQDVTCNGGNDGEIQVSGSGGTTPYQFSLNGGTSQTSGVFSGLSAGTYTVEIEDANGCTETSGSITINEPGNTLSCTVGCDPDNDTIECSVVDNLTNMNNWHAANMTKLEGCITGCINNWFEVTSDYDPANLSDLCGSSGVITVIYTITDECDNFITKPATYTITDSTAPSFDSCPVLDVTEDCTGVDFNTASASWNQTNLTTLAGCVTDICNDVSNVTIVSNYATVIGAHVSSCDNSGNITVIYTLTDDCNNSTTVSGTYIVGDDVAPSFAACAVLDVTEDCTGDDFTVASAAWNTSNLAALAGCVTDNCNEQSEITIVSDYDSVIAAYTSSCADSGDITVTYTATDECGNSDSVTGRLVIGDDVAPSFAACAVLDVTEDCTGDDFTVASAAWNTANLASLASCVTDNCNDQSEITIESDYDAVIAAYTSDCADSGDITVTYTVTDECGNFDTMTGRLVIGDDIAPSFATCPVLDVTEDCTGDDFTAASAAWNTANLASLASCVTDNCNDQSEITIESDYDAVIAAYTSDCADSGDITVTYTVTDECGNFDTMTGRLVIGDDIAPSFTTCPVLDVTEDCTGDDFTAASSAWNTANLASLASCVTDNCNDQSEITIESDYDAVIAAYTSDCADSGDITVTYTVTDECGNFDTMTGRLVIGDDIAPSFATCPVLDVTEDCTGDDFTVASAAWNTANLASLASCVTDNCNDQSEITIESDYGAVIAAYTSDCADSGDITVTYTVTDECGNFDTMTGRLVIGDDIAPSFATCPVLDVTEDCTGDDFTVASAAWNTANLASLASCVTDNCNDQSEITIESDYDAVIAAYTSDCADSGDITVTYTVTDECGNFDTMTGRLVIGDDIAPSFATCPVLDVTEDCTGDDFTTASAAWNTANLASLASCVTDNCNDQSEITIESDYDAVIAAYTSDCADSGDITVTYTVTDECGNFDTMTGRLVIGDDIAPSFATCPVLDVTEDCTGDDFTVASAAWNTANLASLASCVTDNCNDQSEITIESDYDAVIAAYTSDCADSGDITVTYTVTDECGNFDTMTGRLVIGDDIAPSFATCPVLDVTEDCTGDDFTVASAAWNTANLASLASCVTDNCNDQSEILIESDYDAVIAAYTSDCADSGDITVTYTVTDECGNFDTMTGRLVIGDDIAPSFATCPVLDVTEDCTGDDFTVASAAWNTANLASLASCVTDNCNDQSEILIESDYDVVIAAYVGDCADSGDITVTYTVTDECGNSDTVTGRLIVGDDEAPSFATCPVLDVTEDCTGDDFTVASAAWNTANLASLASCVTDNCNDQSEILIESDYDAVIAAYVGDCADSGDITVTYTVTDECGNSDTVTGRLIVGDDEAPSFATCPVLDLTEDCTGDDFTVASAAWNTANLTTLAGCVTDNCNDQSEILIESDYDAVIAAYVGDCADSGDITVTYTVTDECGNSDTVTGRLIVGDDEAPSFATCPVLDVTEDCTGDDFTVASAAWNTANLASLASCVTDNCNDQSEILIESDYDAVIATYVGDCADSGDITVTYTVTDECGNFDTVTGRLIVGDDEAPSFATCPVLDVTEDCTGDDFTVASAAWNTANLTTLAGCVTDNCNDQSEILIESDYDAVIAAYVGDCADSGDITVTYTVTDECGNSDTVTGRLIVGDDEAPSFATCPVLDVTEDCTGDDFTVASAAWNTANLTTLAGCVTDNCNDQSEILIESDYDAVIAAYVGDCADSGDITVTYTVTDECGNSDTVTGRLIVGDDEAPSFATCPVLDVTEDCTGDDFTVASAAWNTANLASLASCVTDNCNDQSEILIESDYDAVIATYVGDCADSGDITVTYTVTDECGNFDTVTGRLIVGDDEAPSFATCPVLDVTEDCTGDDFTVASAAWNTANLTTLAGCVTDNCNDQSEILIESDYDAVIAAYVGDCADSGDITVTYTVTDECGNSDTVTGRLIVGDDEAPSFATCPVLDVTEDCTGDDFTVASAAWNTANLTTLAGCVTDNCNDQSEILIESDYDAVIAAYVGDCADSGDITVTYTVTDECGNSDTVTGRLIVGDDEAPSFATCPVLDVTEDCTGDDFTVASAAWNTANLASLASCVTDNCNDQSEILIESDYDAVIATYVGDCADSGDITVTYTVTDECGNFDTVTGRLIVGDDEAPSFATCPVLDVTEDCTGDDFTVASAAWNTANLTTLAGCVTDNCNDQSEILIESDYDAVIAAYVGDCADSGDITVTYTVTDECGNSDTVTGRLIVGDDEAPSFATCPVLDVTEDCTGDDFTVASAAWNTANLTTLAGCVTDNCNDQSEILIESDYDAVIAAYVGDCADSGDITVTYTVTDECGNSDTVTGRLIVGDDEAPSFATCPVLDVTEDCTGDDFTVASAAWNTANLTTLAGCVTDNCNDQSEILIESDYDAVIAAYVGDCADSGDITVTYTVTDECGNFDTVTGRLIVGDDEAPSFATCPVLDVTEDCTGDDFTVASAAWNTANLTTLAGCVTDNCNDQSEILIESDYDAVIAAYVGDCADSGDITVTYTVTDECGNSDTVTGRLIVGDDEAPSFATCPVLDVTEDCTGDDFTVASAAWNTANLTTLAGCVTDNCNDQSEITIESDYDAVIAAYVGDCADSGDITVTYTVTDECGNSDTVTGRLIVGDDEAPSFATCPVLDVTEDCTGDDFTVASAAWNTANLTTLAGCVTDNCNDQSEILIESDYDAVIAAYVGDCADSGDITVTYTVTDECGNFDTVTGRLIVGDDEAPSFATCPVLDVTEDCTGDDFTVASAAWNTANLTTLAGCVTDNCNDQSEILIESDYDAVIAAYVGDCADSGDITVTYTVIDECGNSDTVTGRLIVGDDEAPSFATCPVLDVTEDCTGDDFTVASAAWNTANLTTLAGCVTDNCNDQSEITIESDYDAVIAAYVGDCADSGDITVTYTVTDECGNSDTVTGRLIVGDDEAPSFATCPVLDVTEDCTGDDFTVASAAWNTANLTTLAGCVTDNCNDQSEILIESDYDAVIAAYVGDCADSGDITVTYTVTDECGNSDTVTGRLIVGDDEAPSFATCPVLDVTEDCTGDDFTVASAAWNTANLTTLAGCVTDNCNDQSEILIESDYDAVIAAYVGDCADSGDITVTYTVTDECGNSDTVTGRLIVGDDEAPSFAGCVALDVTEDCTGIDFATASASWDAANLATLATCVTDNCNDQSEIIIESDYADVIAAHVSTCDNSGDITVTYTLTDECGNSDSISAAYSVGDDEAPSFAGCAALDVTEDCTGVDFATASSDWNTANLTALAGCVTDNCSDVADIIIESDYADVIAAHVSTCDNSGDITVTYTLTDECGNSDSISAAYSVGDDEGTEFCRLCSIRCNRRLYGSRFCDSIIGLEHSELNCTSRLRNRQL